MGTHPTHSQDRSIYLSSVSGKLVTRAEISTIRFSNSKNSASGELASCLKMG